MLNLNNHSFVHILGAMSIETNIDIEENIKTENECNLFRILVATDNHLGCNEEVEK